jgi:hypothetical protein
LAFEKEKVDIEQQELKKAYRQWQVFTTY